MGAYARRNRLFIFKRFFKESREIFRLDAPAPEAGIDVRVITGFTPGGRFCVQGLYEIQGVRGGNNSEFDEIGGIAGWCRGQGGYGRCHAFPAENSRLFQGQCPQHIGPVRERRFRGFQRAVAVAVFLDHRHKGDTGPEFFFYGPDICPDEFKVYFYPFEHKIRVEGIGFMVDPKPFFFNYSKIETYGRQSHRRRAQPERAGHVSA